MVDTADKAEYAVAECAVDALLTCVRLRAQLRLLWMQSSKSRDSMLQDPQELVIEEEQFYASDPSAKAVRERIRDVDVCLARTPEWTQLRESFGLSEFEMQLLALSVAASVDPQLGRVYAYLHEDPAARDATPWLTACLFQIELAPLTPRAPLFRWRLAAPTNPSPLAWTVTSPWSADPYILQFLLGFPSADPALVSAGVRFVRSQDSADVVSLYPTIQDDILRFIRTVRGSSSEQKDSPIEVELLGDAGSGKRTLAAQCAARLGANLITIDADQLNCINSLPAEEIVIRVARAAILTQSAVYWAHSDKLKKEVMNSLPRNADLVFFGAEDGSQVARRPSGPHRTFTLPPLARAMRSALWKEATPYPLVPVIEQWILTPAEIVAAAEVACAGSEAVVAACRENLRAIGRDLFVPLPCPFTWEDIVLPLHTREHLRELEQQVKLRWQVYEEWGFERLCPVGSGITAMFSGPSGTGKTMAAQVLARALDLELFRVDLSGVMSKYIGETEKRLKQVFDACERSNVLLFFDEADALFGQRTRVEHAHDRFANIEIDYLLQRMEQFDGIAVLATNRKNDLDKAFLRRIRFMVEFPPPGPQERQALWRRVLPALSPKGEELLGLIDWDLLANKLEMTGAEIAASALNAAFLARAESARITMSHVLKAARRELNKQGVMLRATDWES